MSDKVFIIAEAGVNHNGSIELAYQMIDKAVDACVDAVKFQTFISSKSICKHAVKADYQKIGKDDSESQYEMVKKLELSFEEFVRIKEYCDHKNIMFLSTPFDHESIDFLNNLGLEIFKIPSGEITNYPYLVKIAKLNKKIILSTGMATLEEIEDVINILGQNGSNDITILHCNTAYPTPLEDVNLNAMNTIKDIFKVEVGYSDHTLGTEISLAAVALGAKVIEKHFTLDKNMEGPDHSASIEPDELKNMVKGIRNIEKALGDGVKRPSDSELKNKEIARKSIVASCDIKKGERFSVENLVVKRPGTGVSPMRWNETLGMVAKRNFLEDELIEI